jgi:hypothetical protein
MDRYKRFNTDILILGVVLIATFFGSLYQVKAFEFPFLEKNKVEQTQSHEPIELEVDIKEPINTSEVEDLVKNIPYNQLVLQGDVIIGNNTLSDFTTINTLENLNQVDSKVREQRDLLLFNIEKTSSSSQDKSLQSYSLQDIQKSREDNQKNRPTFKSLTMVTDKEWVEALKTKRNPKVKDIRVKNTKEKQKVSSTINTLTEYFKKGLIGSAQASGTWWPNYTSIAFFDTDEVGFNPNPIWNNMDSLSGTRTNNGVDSVYHLAQDGYWVYNVHTGTDGRTYIGRIRPTGTGWSGWKMISDSTTDRYPTLMTFRGAIYVGVKNQDGNIYIRHSDDDWNNWTNFRPVGRQTTHGFGIIGYNNSLCVFHKGLANSRMYIGCSGNEWSFASNIWREVSGETNQSVVLSSGFGELWQGHIGTNGNQVFLRSTRDPNYWGGWWQLNGGQSPRIFDITSYNPNGTGEQICVIISGTDNIVSQTCGRKSGTQVQWHPWQRQGIGSVTNSPTAAGTNNSLFQMAAQSGGITQYRFLSSTPSARGYISWMKWNNRNFGTNDTYEHEVYLYNYDDSVSSNRKTYMTKSGTGSPNCMPTVQYAASNLPSPYLDTRLDQNGSCDHSGNEVSYTIGTPVASSLSNTAMYFTYWQTDEGALYKPIFKVQGQLGYRLPSNCLTTWCSFKSTTLKLIPVNNSGSWINNPNQGYSYPYWFQESWQ